MIRAFLEKVGLLRKSRSVSPRLGKHAPHIIPRAQHGISRQDISENALKVLNRLHQHGYDAYLVGGGVRDLLLGLRPKDFDVATNAKPEEVRRIFRNCRLIGRRFRLAHVYFGHDIIEVATFRGKTDPKPEELSHSEHGMILRDNVYGTLEEDAWRRDFTINALYYNIADFSVVDYTGGFSDLKAKRLCMIGDVAARYREDPVRMLRALRFACKTNFELPKELSRPIAKLKDLIGHVSSSRLFEEMMKLFHSGNAAMGYALLKKHDLFSHLFPATEECLHQEKYPTDALLQVVFRNTDLRIAQGKPVTPTFIIAALLWHPIRLKSDHDIANGMPVLPARMQAIETVIHRQMQRLSIPRRITQGAREIWLLQMRLHKRHGKHPSVLMTGSRFRAAYDFLELRAQAGEPVADLFQWWQQYIEGDDTQRLALQRAVSQDQENKKSRKRHRRKKAPDEKT